MMGSENRDRSWRKALRKRRIANQVYPHHRNADGEEYSYYDNLHQYSKNKIHCSCPLCSRKTKNKGKRRKKDYDPSVNYKVSDQRKLDALEFGKLPEVEEDGSVAQ